MGCGFVICVFVLLFGACFTSFCFVCGVCCVPVVLYLTVWFIAWLGCFVAYMWLWLLFVSVICGGLF